MLDVNTAPATLLTVFASELGSIWKRYLSAGQTACIANGVRTVTETCAATQTAEKHKHNKQKGCTCALRHSHMHAACRHENTTQQPSAAGMVDQELCAEKRRLRVNKAHYYLSSVALNSHLISQTRIGCVEALSNPNTSNRSISFPATCTQTPLDVKVLALLSADDAVTLCSQAHHLG